MKATLKTSSFFEGRNATGSTTKKMTSLSLKQPQQSPPPSELFNPTRLKTFEADQTSYEKTVRPSSLLSLGRSTSPSSKDYQQQYQPSLNIDLSVPVKSQQDKQHSQQSLKTRTSSSARLHPPKTANHQKNIVYIHKQTNSTSEVKYELQQQQPIQQVDSYPESGRKCSKSPSYPTHSSGSTTQRTMRINEITYVPPHRQQGQLQIIQSKFTNNNCNNSGNSTNLVKRNMNNSNIKNSNVNYNNRDACNNEKKHFLSPVSQESTRQQTHNSQDSIGINKNVIHNNSSRIHTDNENQHSQMINNCHETQTLNKVMVDINSNPKKNQNQNNNSTLNTRQCRNTSPNEKLEGCVYEKSNDKPMYEISKDQQLEQYPVQQYQNEQQQQQNNPRPFAVLFSNLFSTGKAAKKLLGIPDKYKSQPSKYKFQSSELSSQNQGGIINTDMSSNKFSQDKQSARDFQSGSIGFSSEQKCWVDLEDEIYEKQQKQYAQMNTNGSISHRNTQNDKSKGRIIQSPQEDSILSMQQNQQQSVSQSFRNRNISGNGTVYHTSGDNNNNNNNESKISYRGISGNQQYEHLSNRKLPQEILPQRITSLSLNPQAKNEKQKDQQSFAILGNTNVNNSNNRSCNSTKQNTISLVAPTNTSNNSCFYSSFSPIPCVVNDFTGCTQPFIKNNKTNLSKRSYTEDSLQLEFPGMPRTVSIIPKNNESLKNIQLNSIQKPQHSSEQYAGDQEGYQNQPEIRQGTTFSVNSFDNENVSKKITYPNEFNSKTTGTYDTHAVYFNSPTQKVLSRQFPLNSSTGNLLSPYNTSNNQCKIDFPSSRTVIRNGKFLREYPNNSSATEMDSVSEQQQQPQQYHPFYGISVDFKKSSTQPTTYRNIESTQPTTYRNAESNLPSHRQVQENSNNNSNNLNQSNSSLQEGLSFLIEKMKNKLAAFQKGEQEWKSEKSQLLGTLSKLEMEVSTLRQEREQILKQ